MAKYVRLGDSIECNCSEINTRKPIIGNANARVEISGQKLYKYKTQINTDVVITEELNPKEAIIEPNSGLNKDDSVNGDVVEIYLKKIMNFKKKSNYSSKHSIYSCKSSCFTYARIAMPWRLFLEMQTAIQ